MSYFQWNVVAALKIIENESTKPSNQGIYEA